MFIVQGIIRLVQDREEVRKHDEHYDGLLQTTEGMYWNIYLERLDDPGLTIHSMGWRDQATSEAFGVSEGFQNLRKMSAASTGRISLEGPLSPGYWRPTVLANYAPPPTGYDASTMGFATQAMVFVIPGSEVEYIAAEQRIADALRTIGGAYWLHGYHNLGQVNAFSRLIHWRDAAAAAAGIAALGDAEEARKALVLEERGGPCQVKLFSDWPGRRATDGV